MKRIASFLASQSEDILSAGFIIMGFSALSGILGVVRSRLLASEFSPDLVGIYFAAFVIPDNIFQVLVISAMGAAFIPVFAKHKREGSHWQFTNAMFNTLLFIFLILTLLVFLFTEQLLQMVVPGVQKENPEHLILLTNMTRIILLAQIPFLFSYIATGVLHAHQRFIISATTPAFYNLGIIIGIIFITPYFGMYGVAVGIIVGAFLHFIIQLPLVLQLGFRYRFTSNIFHPGVKQVFLLMGPRAFSIALERLKVTIDTFLASIISLASIEFLNFAIQVAVFPVSLFAAGIGQAAFPFLAKAAGENDLPSFKNHMSRALTHIVFFLAPTTVIFVVLHTPITRLAFGSENFPWEATFFTSWTLVFLSLSLVFQGMGGLLAKGFFALYDTRTPLVITFFSLLSAILLSLLFVLVLHLPVWSLGISSSVGFMLNAVALFIFLDKKVKGFNRFPLFLSFSKIILISIFLGFFSYGIFKFFEQFFDTTYTLSLLAFTAIVAILSLVFYLLLSFIFNLEEYKELIKLFEKVKRAPKSILKKEVVVSEPKFNS